jgi:putative ABC transport system permease protein
MGHAAKVALSSARLFNLTTTIPPAARPNLFAPDSSAHIPGGVVVAQTMYSSTMDHLREFGTPKAMGATNAYIYRIIMKQAAIAAVIGSALGISLSVLVVHESGKGGANILLPWQLAVGMFGVTLLMCVIAAFVSINKVTKLDPALVFKQ